MKTICCSLSGDCPSLGTDSPDVSINRAKYWGFEVIMSVCLFVCLSVCLFSRMVLTPKHLGRTSPNFLRMLPVSVAQSSSDGVAICYVFPVLRMMSSFHNMGPMGRIKHDIIFRRVLQVEIRYQCLVEFVCMRIWAEICCLWFPCYICNSVNAHILSCSVQFS